MIRVAIVEDQREIREGLKALISGTPGYGCAGAWGSMEEALEHIGRDMPDVLLADIGLPGMPGTEGIRLLKQRHPGLPALMITVYEDDERIFAALCAGACGYLLKSTPPARLLECLQEAVDGGAPMSPPVARRVIDLFRDFRPPEKSDRKLTPHETRLLALLVASARNLQDRRRGDRLSVSATVAWHMRSIYEKLQVHSRSEA